MKLVMMMMSRQPRKKIYEGPTRDPQIQGLGYHRGYTKSYYRKIKELSGLLGSGV